MSLTQAKIQGISVQNETDVLSYRIKHTYSGKNTRYFSPEQN